MPSLKVFFCFVVLFVVSSYAQDRHAIVYLQSTSLAPDSIYGSVTFIQQADGIVTVTADIDGLPDGSYAIHVNEFGDLSSRSGTTTGTHYGGVTNSTHGCPELTDERHLGDMGAWTSVDGNIYEQKQLNLLQLAGNSSIVGRSVVLYELTDPCNGNGDSGNKWAYGVIGVWNRHTSQANQEYNATLLVCNLEGTSNCPDCSGTVWFEDRGDGSIRVTAEVFGLAFGTVHAIHVHTYGDLTKADGTSLGPHWNPDGNLHGLPDVDDRHAGDLGNIQNYDEFGTAWYKYDTEVISSTGSITGRGVVVHELPDHGRGYGCDNATGSAGVRFAVCVIGIAAQPNITVVPDVPIRISNDWNDVDCQVPPEETTFDTSIRSFASHFTSQLYVFTSTNSSPVLTASFIIISIAFVLLI